MLKLILIIILLITSIASVLFGKTMVREEHVHGLLTLSCEQYIARITNRKAFFSVLFLYSNATYSLIEPENKNPYQ